MMRFRRPSWRAWCLLVIGVAICGSAGWWQYGKGIYKRDRQARFAQAVDALPIRLDHALADDGERDAVVFKRVEGSGRYLPQRYLLDNQVRTGRPGVEAFAPLRIADGSVVLVALGWLPYGDARREIPVLPSLPEGEVTLLGLLTPPPAHGLRFGREWAQAQGYPKLMPYFALEDVAADLGEPLAAQVLRIDPSPESPYRRDWHPVQSMPPARHFAYAWQWWALATAIVVVFVVVHRKREGADAR